MPVQKANHFGFTVTWPEGMEPPMGCPQSYPVWYGRQSHMDLAAEGYRMEGAAVTPLVRTALGTVKA